MINTYQANWPLSNWIGSMWKLDLNYTSWWVSIAGNMPGRVCGAHCNESHCKRMSMCGQQALSAQSVNPSMGAYCFVCVCVSLSYTHTNLQYIDCKPCSQSPSLPCSWASLAGHFFAIYMRNCTLPLLPTPIPSFAPSDLCQQKVGVFKPLASQNPKPSSKP